MKFNLEAISFKVIIFLILILSFFPVVVFAAPLNNEDLKIEKTVSVKAEIPLFQRVNIVEVKDVDYEFLMNNYEGTREIVIENAVQIEIISNSDWNLRLNNRNLYSEIMIKKSNQNDVEWQKLNSTTARFQGEQGIHKINFDLKYILDESPKLKMGRNNLGIDLRLSLEPILY